MGVTSVTSEALQLKLRQLLPSQQGFGSDISASDTIIPIIDLTASAEGSDVRNDLQSALNFGGATVFDVKNTSADIITTVGFFRVIFNYFLDNTSASNSLDLDMTDGSTTKSVWGINTNNAAGGKFTGGTIDLIVFNALGITTKIVSNMDGATAKGSVRQIANSNGELIQPVGFTPQ